jgi:hypothetical protein
MTYPSNEKKKEIHPILITLHKNKKKKEVNLHHHFSQIPAGETGGNK